jgi:hypothetical protein
VCIVFARSASTESVSIGILEVQGVRNVHKVCVTESNSTEKDMERQLE